MKRFLKIGSLVVVLGALLAAAACGLAAWRFWEREMATPYRGYLADELELEIPYGSGAQEIGALLERNGVIKSSDFFLLYMRLQEIPTLMAGTYRFSSPLKLPEVVAKLKKGEVVQRRLTIPEGRDLTEIASIWEAEGFGKVEAFVRAATDVSLIADIDPEARDLEGYLFPNTYFLSGPTEESEIVRRMVANSRAFWTPERRDEARRLGMTPREVVTLASLIEKETGTPAERPLVSAVFHNRLRLGIRLMCDPTVIYAVRLRKPYDGVIHQSDLALNSAYNTYLYPGLPPGPITNPGERSLEAALTPAPADYLYFVSRNDGTHVFSRDYGSHQRAVQRFQR